MSEDEAPKVQFSKVSGVVRYSGGTVVLSRGQSVESTHPLAVERPNLFTDEDPGATLKGPRRVETAMQRPGEVRSESVPLPVEPKATPAKKAAAAKATKATGGTKTDA